MKNITWIASYPKSGSTWIRSILFCALNGSLNINEMGNFIPNFATIASTYLGDNFQDPMDIRYKWQQAQKQLSQTALSKNQNLIIKTHNAAGKYDVGIFPSAEYSSNAVYIVRDPRDVAVSYSKHFNHSIKIAVEKLQDENLINIQPISRKRGEFTSSRQNHIRGWQNSEIPVLFIKYEDLLENPKENISKIFEFLSIKPLIEISEIIKLTNFKELSELENKNGFIEASSHSKFFRKGGKAQWKKIPSTSFKLVEKRNFELMNELGYL